MVADVTVVIPTRNRAGTLVRTLATVLAQRDVDLEVLVVDDGSTDDTAGRLAAVGDARLRVVRHDRPAGVAAARNRGIAAAEGTWVATLDDDDLWRDDKLAAQLRSVRETGRVWGYAGAVHFLPGPALWRLDPPPRPDVAAERLPHDNVVPAGASNVVVRRDVLDDVGRFDPALHHMADWDLWLRLIESGPPAVVDRYLLAYRLHEGNMGLAAPEGILAEADEIDRRYRHLRGGRPLDRTPVHYWVAVMCWRAGRRREARRSYLRAVRDGNVRALGRVARTLVPVASLRQLLRRPGPEWPPGFEAWLREASTDHAW